MVYHEGVWHNYVIPFHRKYKGQHNQRDILAGYDGKVGSNTAEYATAFLYCVLIAVLPMAWYNQQLFTEVEVNSGGY